MPKKAPQGSASAARAVGANPPQPPGKLNPTHDHPSHSNRPYPRTQPTQQSPRIGFTQLIAANNQPPPRARVRRDALQLRDTQPTRCACHTTQLPTVRLTNRLISGSPDAELHASSIDPQLQAGRYQASVLVHRVQQHKRASRPECGRRPDPICDGQQHQPRKRCMNQCVYDEQRARRRNAQRECLKPSHGSLRRDLTTPRQRADCGR